jgi:hypothetical protein
MSWWRRRARRRQQVEDEDTVDIEMSVTIILCTAEDEQQ